jgi:hypothetical protein
MNSRSMPGSNSQTRHIVTPTQQGFQLWKSSQVENGFRIGQSGKIAALLKALAF